MTHSEVLALARKELKGAPFVARQKLLALMDKLEEAHNQELDNKFDAHTDEENACGH